MIFIGVDVQGEFGINPARIGPRLHKAVRAAVMYVAARWREAAVNGIGDLPPTKSRSYIDGIGAGIEYPYGNEWTGRIVNRAPDARRIEQGYARFDMKPGLLFGPQARMMKNGGTYNIVPFRWGTPRQSESEAGTGSKRATLQTMPQEIYDIVKDFRQSRQTRAFYVPAVFSFERGKPGAQTGSPVTMAARRVREYTWGDRLPEEEVSSPFDQPAKPWHVTNLFSGMVRMATDDNLRRTSSNYLTFRTVSVNSKPEAWWHPGQKGRPYSKEVARETGDVVRKIIRSAVRGSR